LRDIPREPEQTEERRVSLTESWPLPVVVVAYHVPFDGHPDSYPLQVASKVLSDGQSSRIYRSLVYEKQVAFSAYGGGAFIEDPNLFFAVAVVQAGRSADEAERALVEELDRLRNEPVTERELQRVKNQLARDYILGRESNQRKALQLAHAIVIHKRDASTADGDFDTFMHTTAEDVQRVARTYFTPQNRTVLTILPAGAKQ
jgi:zinc protease